MNALDSMIIAIDFGTSKLCAGYFDTKFSIIETPFERDLNNYVTFGEEFFIGLFSKKSLRSNYDKTLFDVKIFIDKNIDEKLIESIEWPFKLHKSSNGKFIYELNGEKFHPEVIFALFLQEMKEFAEKKCNKKIDKIIVTTPSYFTHSARQSIINASKIADLEVVRLLNDNTAASIQIAAESKITNAENVLIFNLGYYYLNLTLFKIKNGCVKIKAAKSCPGLGGKIIDHNIARYVLKKLNISNVSNKLFQTLLLECENAKKSMSNKREIRVHIDSILDNQNDLECKLTIEEFELINKELFENITNCIDSILNEIKLDKRIIDEIFLIGGSSYIKSIRNLVASFFGQVKINYSLNANEVVTEGAMTQAAFLSNKILSTNDGFSYNEITSNEYKLRIFFKCEQFFEISINKFSMLPAEQNVRVKLSQINICVYQNFKQIVKYKTKMNKKTYVYFKFTLDINGLLDLKLTYDDENGKIVTLNLMEKGAENLNSDEIDFFRKKLKEFNNEKNQSLLAFNKDDELEKETNHSRLCGCFFNNSSG